ncbi:MAG TPA: hypothetical protein VGQ15_05240 [Gaiellaceae bacterium]|jgi:hypothetical protein|nr:hypothetical protein [Gaiellaceae bacterium]
MSTTDVSDRSELERVERWRATELERAGYPADGAARLATRHDVDLHRAIKLVENGCPPELALKILL